MMLLFDNDTNGGDRAGKIRPQNIFGIIWEFFPKRRTPSFLEPLLQNKIFDDFLRQKI